MKGTADAKPWGGEIIARVYTDENDLMVAWGRGKNCDDVLDKWKEMKSSTQEKPAQERSMNSSANNIKEGGSYVPRCE